MEIAEPLDRLIEHIVALASGCDNPARVVPLLQTRALTANIAGLGAAPSPDAYTRNLLYRDDRFELVVIRWGASSRSPIHDHAGQQCQSVVLEGTLRTDDYQLIDGGSAPGHAIIDFVQTTLSHPGDVDIRSVERDIHLVSPVNGSAASLHLYTKPIDRCMTFDPIAQRCSEQRSRYDWAARTEANQRWVRSTG